MSSQSSDLDQLRQDAARLSEWLPRASSKDEALDIAIKAAETALSALKIAKDSNEKANYSARAKQLMQDAETIKRSDDWKKAVQQASKVSLLTEPVNSRELSTKERIILLRAGFLNGVKFPEWNGAPSMSEFELQDGEEAFLYVSLCPLISFTTNVQSVKRRSIGASTLGLPARRSGRLETTRGSIAATVLAEGAKWFWWAEDGNVSRHRSGSGCCH